MTTPTSGPSWIANLQTGYGRATKITQWPNANALVIIAKGAAYFIRPDSPSDWTFLDLLGMDCITCDSPSKDWQAAPESGIKQLLPDGNRLDRKTRKSGHASTRQTI